MTSHAWLNSTHLIVVLNRGSTLSQWDEIGILHRELAIYKLLAKKIARVSIVTWSKGDDQKYASQIAPIQLIYNTKAYRARVWQFLFWFRASHWRDQNVIFKTNQLQGADWVTHVAKRARAPLIVRCGYLWSLNSARETGVSAWQTRKARRIEKFAFQSSNVCIVTTSDIQDRIVREYRISPDKVVVLPNFVDRSHFYPVIRTGENTTKSLRILAVGRLSPEKNFEDLLRAVAISGGWKLTIVGNGTLRKKLEHLADELCLDVVFHGNLKNSQVAKLMQKTDVYAITSWYEGNPKSLLEAMACGAAVVGNNVPGIKEVISHMETGLIYNDKEYGLVKALEVLKHKATRDRLGANAARQVALENDLENYAIRLTQVIGSYVL